MKIGLYGGSFDPIHRGHVEPVLEARAVAALDRVIYLPTARPPHKQERRLISPQARFTMVELALLDHPDLEVSDFEMDPDRPAYTVKTLEHFRDLFGQDAEQNERELHLIIGGDSFVQLDRWYRFQDILKLARLVVMTRPGWTPDPKALHSALVQALNNERVILVENRPISASSTEIRRLLNQGEPVPDRWLPERVLKYIEKYGFYGSPTRMPNETS